MDIPQRHASFERRGDERVPERMRPYLLGQPGAAGDAADDPSGAVPVQPLPGSGGEDRSFAALADGEVDRAGGARGERDDGFLAALAGDRQRPVSSLGAQGFDVGAGGLGHAQPVEGEQRDQRVLGGCAEPGAGEQGADLVAVQAGGVGLIIQAGPADVPGSDRSGSPRPRTGTARRWWTAAG
jgi:hypothetical protein